jgi:hypothetical protein
MGIRQTTLDEVAGCLSSKVAGRKGRRKLSSAQVDAAIRAEVLRRRGLGRY